MKGSTFVSNFMEAYDVSHIFFIPVILPHALAEIDKNTNIKRIMPHSEKSAVYMADGYARASRKPGICMAQKVGAANTAAALKDPFLACSPVIAITGGPYTETRNRNTYQEIDDLAMFKSVTKSSVRINDPRQLPETLRQAFRVSTTGKPGPSHIEIPGQLGEGIDMGEIEENLIVEKESINFPALRPIPETKSIEKIIIKILESERPIIIAGGGVKTSGAQNELLELSEKLSIPVATSLNGKDVYPGNHRLNVGIPGLYSNTSANKSVLSSDLVIFIGSQTSSQLTLDWQVPRAESKIIQIDIDPEEIGKHYPVEASAVGDAKVTLNLINKKVNQINLSDRSDWISKIDEFKKVSKNEVEMMMISEDSPIRPERLCKDISTLFPENSILVSDTGHSGIWSGTMVDFNNSSQQYIRAAGSLGWGFPASLGAKAANPDNTVICFTGDGGFWYHLSEIETAVRWNLNSITIVNNNSSLNQEIGVNERAYGGKLTHNHGDLWKFKETNFKNVAESLGAKGIRVENPNEISSAIQEAVESNKPCVIDVVTDIYALPPKPWLG